MNAIAYMFVFNEVDILSWSVQHAVDQGLHVHLIDNFSDDGSYEMACGIAAADQRITVSRWPESGPPSHANLSEMLDHVDQMAARSRFDWCMIYDADEIRRSSRPQERLADAIARIDAAGFNAIDHDLEVYVQRDGFDGSQNPETYLVVRQLDHSDQHLNHLKCWKNLGCYVNLNSHGGHRVSFAGIKIAPERLILKHYPLRSQEQAHRKVRSRNARWAPSDRRLGWHTQYDGSQVAVVTLTRFPDLFDRLRHSIDSFEQPARKIVVTSGEARIDAPGWEVIPGSEPFAFSRNANIGLRAAGEHDVLLVNDDCELLGPALHTLASIAKQHKPGILSPQIRGGVGNRLQREGSRGGRYYTSQERLAFVAAYIPQSTRQRIGLLDERFNGYGMDDDEYCRRARRSGLHLGITSSVVVKHGNGDRNGASASFSRLMTEADRIRSMREMASLLDTITKENHNGINRTSRDAGSGNRGFKSRA